MNTPKITVHHLESSRSHRILWLLAELELPYELKVYRRDPATLRAPPELRAVHPLGKSPVVTVGDLTLAESGHIIEQLIERCAEGRLRPPPGTPEAERYSYWLHFAEGSLMPPLLVKLILERVRTAPLPFFIRPIAKAIANKVDANYTNAEINNLFTYVETELTRRPYLAGDAFTAAEIQMSYPAEAALQHGRIRGEFPRTREWLEGLQRRPAYKAAIEKGGPTALDLG